MGITPRLTRMLSQLTICSSKGSRKVHKYSRPYPNHSSRHLRPPSGPLVACDVDCQSHLPINKLCWLDPNKATTRARTLCLCYGISRILTQELTTLM